MKEERHISKKIESLIDSSLERVKSLIDVNCVIGEPLTMPDGSTIWPISKVTMGFVCGGGEYNESGMWVPNKKGLGMGHVFDELNRIYGDDFIRYKPEKE